MENYKTSINRKPQIDLGRKRFTNGVEGYDIPPPNGESLEMCAQRAVAYFKDNIEPQLQSGKNVMIAAHGNSLSKANFRSVFYMRQVISLELSTGIPLLYIFKEGKFIRRGSPVAPTETGVYAYYTKGLAQYRQKLDELLH
ncbi:hypothetical protein V6N13_118437 [Hibiscus sabdariffa]